MPLIRPAIVTFAALTVLTGLAYPALVTGLGKSIFRHQAEGSLLQKNGQTLGSELIGQFTEDPRYFWGRLSATPDFPANATRSGASNASAGNPDLKQAASRRIQALRKADPSQGAPVPADLVTASASGLDPHISPAAAQFQIPRVAKARGLALEQVQALVARHQEGRTFGILGEPRINVLKLNLALDAATPR